MKKRLIVGLLTGGLLTAMLSIGAAAGNAPDHVQGSAKFDPDWHIWVNAKADADSNGIRGGRNARGTLGLEDKGVGGGKFTADVVCLRVVGSRAWIGAIVSKSDLPGYRVGTHVVRYLIDRGPGASAPPDLSRLLDGVNARLCGRYTPRDLLREVQGNLTVHDN